MTKKQDLKREVDSILMSLLNIEENELGQLISSQKEIYQVSEEYLVSVISLLNMTYPSRFQAIPTDLQETDFINFSLPRKAEIKALKELYVPTRSGAMTATISLMENTKFPQNQGYMEKERTYNLTEPDRFSTTFRNCIKLSNTNAALFSFIREVAHSNENNDGFTILRNELKLQIDTKDRLTISARYKIITNNQEV